MTDAVNLRTRLTRKPIVIAPGIFDALTAHIAEQAGFSTLYVSGAAIAYTRLGRPDIGLVSMSEVADTIGTIRDRVSAHLVVDADTGYETRSTSAGPSDYSSVQARMRSSLRIRHSPSDAGISITKH
jgi:2-methylisocitrate lyase-like PEP mutase family enzyme